MFSALQDDDSDDSASSSGASSATMTSAGASPSATGSSSSGNATALVGMKGGAVCTDLLCVGGLVNGSTITCMSNLLLFPATSPFRSVGSLHGNLQTPSKVSGLPVSAGWQCAYTKESFHWGSRFSHARWFCLGDLDRQWQTRRWSLCGRTRTDQSRSPNAKLRRR